MKVCKRFASVFALLLVASVLFNTVEAGATSSDGNHYTYIYDCWGYDRESPAAYSVTRTITGSDFPCGNFVEPQGMFVKGNELYVADTGNSRIVKLVFENDVFTFVSEIKEFTNNGATETLSKPQDVFVDKEGSMYIADTGNCRIVHLDASGNLVKIITKPDDETVDQKNDFLPQKLVVDSSNRIFTQVQNVNKGFMEFANDGSFTGFVGASKVTYNFLQYLWKMVASQEQRARMDLFVPTEYSNLCLDSEGLIYATIAQIGDEVMPQDRKSVV